MQPSARLVPNEAHLTLLRDGVERWNRWRAEEPLVRPSLRGANLARTDLRNARFSDADLKGVDLSDADLSGARFGDTYLRRAVLRGARLTQANLSGANLRHADLTGAQLGGASLRRADLSEAILDDADLSGATLDYAHLVETRLKNARLDGCSVYGVSAWNLELQDTLQSNLRISRRGEPTVTVDSLEVAQFVYLLLQNKKVRQAIDTLATKVVLILGRFTPERKLVLDALRDALRMRDRLPIIFDFEGPQSKDLTETVRTLAHLSRYIIADLTEPKSIPQELATIVPFLPGVPVRPIIHESHEPWGMFPHFERYPWVVRPPFRYSSTDSLIAALDAQVIGPVEALVSWVRCPSS